MNSSTPARLKADVEKIPPGGNVTIYARISSRAQITGDGIPRQVELCQALANDLGLTVHQIIKDPGQSAYYGANIRDGDFGKYLNNVKNLPAGSILIIEDFDRVSRGSVVDSSALKFLLIASGLTILCYRGYEVFNTSTSNQDVLSLAMGMVNAHRANQESVVKQERLTHAWKNKRKNVAAAFAKGDKLCYSKRCPEWLEWSDEAGWFIERPDRVRIVRRIYEDLTKGMGRDIIARHLNSENIPPWGKGREERWHGGCVQKVTDNRAVLGEFQMHTHEMNPNYPSNRKRALRVPVGDPIQDYFPAVIPVELWRAVRNVSAKRSPTKVVTSGGMQGNSCSNLFRHLAKCGVCGGSMYIRNRSRRTELRYQCRNSSEGKCDHRTLFSVATVETAILRWAADYTPSVLKADNIAPLERSLAELQEKAANKSKSRMRLIQNFEDFIDDPDLKQRIDALKVDVSEIRERIKNVEYELDEARGVESVHQSLIHGMQSKIDNANSLTEKFAIRSAVRESLKEVIETIRFYSNGFAVVTVGRVLIVQFDMDGRLDVIVIPECGYWNPEEDRDPELAHIYPSLPPEHEEQTRRYKAVQVRFNAMLERYRADGVKLSFQLRGDAIRQILTTVHRKKSSSSHSSSKADSEPLS